MRRKEQMNIFMFIIFLIASIASALTVSGNVRLVTIITLYSSGFGAGATLISFLMERKMKNKSETK